ncbi:MAG: outer membrane protein assembly factor BamD [Candidatus Omnitrophota bacterium]
MMNLKIFFLSLLFFSIFTITRSFAFWVWTPETRQWINPKYAVKETPQKQLEYAIEVSGAGDYEKAEHEMRKLIKHYPKAREAAEAQFYMAEFQERRGEISKAFESYQTVIDKYPFTQRTREVVERQYNMACRVLEGEVKEKEKGLMGKIVMTKVDVEKILKQVIKNAPYGEFAPPSQYKIGLYLKEEGLLQEARDAFEKTVNDYPESDWAKAARYQIALADSDRSADAGYDQKITESAIEEFKSVLKDYPDAEFSMEAKGHIAQLREKEAENTFIIAAFYEKQKKYEAAKLYYSTIVNEYKETQWAKQALDKIQSLGKNQ